MSLTKDNLKAIRCGDEELPKKGLFVTKTNNVGISYDLADPSLPVIHLGHGRTPASQYFRKGDLKEIRKFLKVIEEAMPQ